MRALLAGLWLERSGRFLWKRRWHAVDAERAALVDFDHDVSAVPLPPLFRGAVPLEAIRSVETSGDDWPHANPVAPGCNPMRPGCNPMRSGCNPMRSGCNPMRSGCNPMPPGDDCLTLQLRGDLGTIALRVPSIHGDRGAADEGRSLRGAVKAVLCPTPTPTPTPNPVLTRT